jgi:hypothetical protein
VLLEVPSSDVHGCVCHVCLLQTVTGAVTSVGKGVTTVGKVSVCSLFRGCSRLGAHCHSVERIGASLSGSVGVLMGANADAAVCV